MKQYLAFFGETYYPLGGMSDLINDFDTVEQAIEAIHIAHKEHDIHNHGWDGHVWCHVYDIKNRTFIYGCPIEYINPEDGNMWEDEPRMLKEGEQVRTSPSAPSAHVTRARGVPTASASVSRQH